MTCIYLLFAFLSGGLISSQAPALLWLVLQSRIRIAAMSSIAGFIFSYGRLMGRCQNLQLLPCLIRLFMDDFAQIFRVFVSNPPLVLTSKSPAAFICPLIPRYSGLQLSYNSVRVVQEVLNLGNHQIEQKFN